MYFSALSSPSLLRGSSTLSVELPNGRRLKAEVMTTSAERSAGMQFRTGFEPETVMLFVHPTEGRYTYHMTNVGFPLEILFFRSGGKLVSVEHAAPGRGSYGGSVKHRLAIEAPSGFVSANNLKMGDRIRLRQ